MIAALTFRTIAIVAIFIGSLVLIFSGYAVVGTILHLALIGFLLAGTLDPSSRIFGPIKTRCGTGIMLTLDDGPDPESTPAILDLLDKHGAKAVFFVIGKKAVAFPHLITEILKRGHMIGNHTWSHPQSSFWCHGPIRTYREIARCQEAIEKISGVGPVFFRAPVGHHNLFVHPVLRCFGMELMDGIAVVSTPLRKQMRNQYPLEFALQPPTEV